MRAQALILCYTLFVDPHPGPITLTSEVHGPGVKVQDHIADAGNMEASEENINIVSGDRYSGRMPP